ncbi:MAG: FtsW/RodA/SpoVE family cell cycle protein [Candidatus Nanopelagicales bacterium]|jgi:cell division protein FtsW (lipid II flippase)|nr:FtsW/RodA/SpoVE family cell cycle protein [Candidatus Nanopelagicales bacterium]MDP4824879.1 FtsW/RodA/SpoVE family cell cycle protein [Candidatus Nanopelagicales bacterium]MDP4887411.1 FtsW/RodA/SpoVE family cell cycle protein [Candidatus Nanopelagicales bacterium]
MKSTNVPATDTVTRPATRRNRELFLLVVAWGLGVLGTLQVGWATGEGTPQRFWVTVAVVGALALAAHVIVRWRVPYADPLLLPLATLLTVLGMTMIYRLDVAAAQRAIRNNSPVPSPDVYSQLIWFAVGITLFTLVLLILRDHRVLQRYTYTAGLIGIVLLLLPLVPGIGATINGATLWVRLGGLSFQPAELAKIALTIFFAGYLVVKRDALALVRVRFLGIGLPRPRDLGPIIVAWALSLGILIFERDLGTSLLFFGLFVAMLYISTQRRSWIILGAGLFAIGSVFSYLAFNHVRVRVQVWIDPFAFADTGGYQIVQSLYGFANGGLLGTGLGNGYPQLVPFANTDFVLASLGEELGLAGFIAIILLYAIMVQRGLRISVAVRDPFGQLLAAGLSITLALQVFVIVGGVTRLIPLTGLTTPFLSYGGSSLIANWILIALLLVISHRARQPLPEVEPIPDNATQVVSR